MRALLIEDDVTTAAKIEAILQAESIVCDIASLRETGFERGRMIDYDIVILDLLLEPRCAPSRSGCHRVAEPLGKNVASATGLRAAKSANNDAHLNGATVRRQVQEAPLVPTVHPL